VDGIQKTVSYSIQHRLSLSLSLLVLFIGILAGSYSFYEAKHEAKEWQDNYLQQILHIYQTNLQKGTSTQGEVFSANNEVETNLYIKKLPEKQEKFFIKNKFLFNLPLNLRKGITTIQGSTDTYRVAIRTLDSGERLIVAQSTIERDELAVENALNALIPIFLLVPLIILLLRKYIAHLFLPIKQVSSTINKSQHDDFSTIALTGLPKEIHPFVISINQLLARIAEHISMQQRFIAEAAHELRTPLTALSLQAERLNGLVTSDEAKAQLKRLRTGINRNRELVSKLLTLAKVQSKQNSIETNILLPDIIKTIIEELMPLAEQKKLDIGVVESQNLYIKANEHELCILFRNLIDNAIKYSHENGIIDISITQIKNKIQVIILDCGPGISSDELEHVFSPFYRGIEPDTIGTGLGLSIVKVITDKLGADIEMKCIANVGFEVIVSF
tara:strand:+ start:4933 stop:6264 length:1332 start_codon:yes stop_codon:yes gene_type:complete